MGSSRPDSDGGYATPAALVLSIAFALIGAAMTVRSVHVLSLTRADLARSRQEHALDGAQLVAATTIVRSSGSGPYAWSFGTDFGLVQVLAEPEAGKLGPDAVAALDDDLLRRLGVADPELLRTKVANPRGASVADLDAALAWRECGPSLVSPLGRAASAMLSNAEVPEPGAGAPAWRVGEAWRLRVTTQEGWRDDRIVRFTGDERHPAAIVSRRLSRMSYRGVACEQLLEELVAH